MKFVCDMFKFMNFYYLKNINVEILTLTLRMGSYCQICWILSYYDMYAIIFKFVWFELYTCGHNKFIS